MANCISATFNGVYAIVAVILRVFLFLVCLPLALGSLYLTTAITTRLPASSFASDGLPVIISFAFVLLWILMHFVGCYGAFFNHKGSLKAFALWTFILGAVIFMSSLSISSDLAEGSPVFKAMLRNSMPQLDWNNPLANNSTKAWNMIQAGQKCCGMKDYHDWDDYRPAGWSYKEYPSACCNKGSADVWFGDSHPHHCHSDEVFTSGCEKSVTAIATFVLGIHQLLVYFEALLFLCTLFIILGQIHPRQPVLPIVAPRNTDPREYQRFDGSVYVRQLPANPSYHNQQPDVKYPSLYPDSPHQSAPPSYGAK